jgi:iron complex outermembrane recepter protein
VNYNRPFKGFSIQVGLRAENTNSDGTATGLTKNTTTNQYERYDSSTKRNYVDLFPSASVSFTKNPMSQFSISYSRRIDRPRYENLNPFEFKLDDYTYMKGNTLLKPQYTNSFGITHTYKYKLSTTLNYSHVKDMFVQVFEKAESSKTMQTTRNLATQDVVSLNISYPFMYKNFTSFNNLNTNYSVYNATFPTYTIKQNSYTLVYYVQNSLKIGKKKDWTAEVTGLYVSPFIWAGTFKGKSMGSIDAGLQKIVLKGKGTLKASVSDIFNTMHFRGEMNYGGIYSKVNANWESRQFKINFTYRFGSNQIKSSRQRNTGLDEESKRANGGGGGNTIGQ